MRVWCIACHTEKCKNAEAFKTGFTHIAGEKVNVGICDITKRTELAFVGVEQLEALLVGRRDKRAGGQTER